ncbi:hypothetical protein PMZ80_006392 [Knufia obscura]|uniref:Enoyl reductase (ER) domain-containing protein n=2 Tax=Knufia TaxID=430999 RepID=A0AAN8ETN1_9EURO|nr:hypothetical protein PMZ80_006392 [Knufia obscura]KAK5953461.1 hypothetical protein OHC33_005405 [Knufia fluminis]
MVDNKVSAVVAYAPAEPGKLNFRHESITINRTEPGPKEVLVRMLAAGICHTDIVVGGIPDGYMGSYPRVLGHEGSGYVEAVGSEISSVQVGDPVLLSYTYCGTCDICTNDVQTYCEKFFEGNVLCVDKVWKGKDDVEVGGKFFGQSSFASLSLIDEKSIVNVKGLVDGDEMLKLFSPMGCGLMTGSGAVVNTAAAKSKDVVLVAGLGAVGLGAIMAAKIQGCREIIAVDRIASRLEIAKQLGATCTYDTNHLDITKDSYPSDFAGEVKALVEDGKINYAFDTTGVLPVVNACIRSLSKRGKLISIGVPITPSTTIIPFDYREFFDGTKRIEVNYLGDCIAKDHVPKMIQWYKEGKFPIDKFIKFYAAKDVAQALEDMKTEVIKPVLVH